jgi:hypothetical protein
MDPQKSHSYNFSLEAVPIMFLSQTGDFMKYLERDGLKFLEFWWNHIGEKLPESSRAPFTGINFQILPVDANSQAVIITLPPPATEGEFAFLGLIRRPDRRFAWVKLPTCRAIGMVRKTGEFYPNGTQVGDLTAQGHFVPFAAGPEPTLEKFTAMLLKLAQTAGSASPDTLRRTER